MEKINLFWFRRDLRLEDNKGLSEALNSGKKVIPIFIFDTEILDLLEDKFDRRVDYIHQALSDIHQSLDSGLLIFYGKPKEIFEQLVHQYSIESVYSNRDYEPKAIQRDRGIAEYLKTKNIDFKQFKDQVIFEQSEIVKNDKSPYVKYTPYANQWKSLLQSKDYQEVALKSENFFKQEKVDLPNLSALGFQKTDIEFERPQLDAALISAYHQYRDFPAMENTTRLGIALRFGTISIRKCVEFALKHNEVWLSELIWREFFMQILYHFPKVENHCFKEDYENIKWRNDEAEFRLWCDGKTGFPIVDAGMRQLNETGFMHNRVRMITASFLTKHLLIDWRWGEAYFAQKLLDYDLAANNGNWQWAAGCGCDAAPYFRVFNPYLQTEKFDKDLKYVKRWNPDYESLKPIVDHETARDRVLKAYKSALNRS